MACIDLTIARAERARRVRRVEGGAVGLLRQMTREAMKRGVGTNSVVPGLIDTSLGRIATLRRPNRTARLPFGRQGTAWGLAYALVFLLCDESSYISGHELVVDGGISMF